MNGRIVLGFVIGVLATLVSGALDAHFIEPRPVVVEIRYARPPYRDSDIWWASDTSTSATCYATIEGSVWYWTTDDRPESRR